MRGDCPALLAHPNALSNAHIGSAVRRCAGAPVRLADGDFGT